MTYRVEQLEKKMEFCREQVDRMGRHWLAGKRQIFLGFPERKKEFEKLAEVYAELARMTKALDELARLGNGNRYGNSEGNQIAQRALGLNPGEIYNHTQA